MGAVLGRAHFCGRPARSSQTRRTAALDLWDWHGEPLRMTWSRLSLSNEASSTDPGRTHSINCYYYQCIPSIRKSEGLRGFKTINIDSKHEWNVQSEQESVFR